ncbi:efflux RND transporter periplasmic adaptor subunit [Lutimonas saemankumensis]|uniref:efflux RND transporter periplasmic adaptor subunit n=1 Tax=Lutimonas saemankumensis TaxID=483016 RepID=UPI001CD611C7|nr:efflux RND transporter periplasmic adaptor subunit [Lutimonas saemankumensis]MCA0931717.1 efflux RND transporter periplasmic adaptor subunit [Lutimonas saemankumensis]
MKKYIIYIAVLFAGFVIGGLYFANRTDDSAAHVHTDGSTEKQMWTCSMHPQIMQPEAGTCPICGMDLVPVISGQEGVSENQFKLTQNAMALANIETTVIGTDESGSGRLKVSGKITENEENIQVQVSYFSGRIEKLYINSTGITVKKGQLLATLYSPELISAQQELITAASLKESQPDLYRAVRNKLKLWKLTETQIEEIESTKEVREYFSIYATVAGTVVEKLVSQGDAVHNGMTMFKIADLNSVWAVFDIYEDQIDQVKEGQDIEVISNSFPNDPVKTTVSFIEPVLNSNSRTVKLRAILNNSARMFKPGMFVEGSLNRVTSSTDQKIMIPEGAVLWTGKRSIVYLKSDANQPIFEMKEVKLGTKFANKYEVLSGLKAGDEIVSHGTFTIDAAAQLQGKRSMMNQPESKKQEASSTLQRRDNVPESFKSSLKNVFETYLLMKDALVKDDQETVVVQSKSMLTELSKVSSDDLEDSISIESWEKIKNNMEIEAGKISATNSLEQQRSHFKDLSNYTTNAVQIFGVGQEVYHQYCPMADNDKGAYWLSDSENVLNPYFGNAMLACGLVKQVIEK